MRNNRIQLTNSYDPVNNPWSSDFCTGIISKINVNEKNFSCMYFLGIQEDTRAKYHDVIQIDDSLVLLPNRLSDSLDIKIIRIPTSEIQSIRLRKLEYRSVNKNEMAFTAMHKIGYYIFLVPYAYSAIVRIDTRSWEVAYINQWKITVDDKISESISYGYFVSKEYAIIDNYLYLPFCSIPAVLKIDLLTLNEKIIYLDTISEGYSCICSINDKKILLAGAGSKKDWLYLVNLDDNTVEKQWEMQTTFNDFSVLKMLKAKNNDVYIFPFQNWGYVDYLDIYCLKYDKLELVNTNLIRDHAKKDNDIYFWGDVIIYANWINENTILYVTGKDFLWHEYDVVTHEYSEYEIVLDTNSKQSVKLLKEYHDVLFDKGLLLGEDEMDFDLFISELTNHS